MPETKTTDLPTLEQAFSSAVETEAPPERPVGPSTPDPDPAPAPEKAPDPEPTADVPLEAVDALVTDEELAGLKDKYTDDPDGLAAELKKTFYTKTQQLAEDRKKLSPLQAFETALSENPETALSALAQQYGLTVAKPPEPTAEETFNAEHVLAGALGDELAFLAPKLAPAMLRLAEHVADQKVQPIAKQSEAEQTRVATERRDQVLADFTGKHPDWKQHEPAMSKLAAEMPYQGTNYIGYMEMLLREVTSSSEADQSAASFTARALTRMGQAAQTSDETAPRSATDTQVRQRPTELPSFEQAAKDAIKGIRYED